MRNRPRFPPSSTASPTGSPAGTASATDANLRDGSTVGSNSTTGVVTRFSSTAVPEPATLAVFGGLALAGVLGSRRRKAAA